MFNWRRRLHRFHFKGCTDIRECTRAKRQRLGMMRLPTLVFGTQVKSSRMLQIWGENDGLVPRFTRQLDPQIPGIKCHKSKLEVFREKVFLGEGVEPCDCISECTGVPNLVPG